MYIGFCFSLSVNNSRLLIFIEMVNGKNNRDTESAQSTDNTLQFHAKKDREGPHGTELKSGSSDEEGESSVYTSSDLGETESRKHTQDDHASRPTPYIYRHDAPDEDSRSADEDETVTSNSQVDGSGDSSEQLNSNESDYDGSGDFGDSGVLDDET